MCSSDLIDEKYTPFGHSDYQTIVADIKKFAAGGKTAVVSTINGDSNVPFYKELGNQGLKATDVPVVAFSVGEEELRGVDTKPLVGHLAAWNYFESIKNPTNTAFIKAWSDYAKAKSIPGHKDKPLTNDPMEATYIGIHMLADTGLPTSGVPQRMAIVLVEQYYDFAAELADQYLVMERGEIVQRGRGADM